MNRYVTKPRVSPFTCHGWLSLQGHPSLGRQIGVTSAGNLSEKQRCQSLLQQELFFFSGLEPPAVRGWLIELAGAAHIQVGN
jgi:hypothetical protein